MGVSSAAFVPAMTSRDASGDGVAEKLGADVNVIISPSCDRRFAKSGLPEARAARTEMLLLILVISP